MRTLGFFAVIMFTFFCKNVLATFNTAENYAFSNLYSTEGTGTIMSGLDLDGSKLYFGNWTEIKSLDLTDSSLSSVGTVGDNRDISFVARSGGLTYTAFSTTSNAPYPYKLGYINASGSYVQRFNEDGVYDAAVNSQGEIYIAANPDALGSKIFRCDFANGYMTEIADIGGYSGGLAFDSQDNLYYADQGIYGERSSSILKFTAQQVSGGGLFFSDAQSVLNIAAGYLVFDEMDDLYATTSYGYALGKYDITSGVKVSDIASASRLEFITKLVFCDDNLYTISTDYVNYFSTIRQITIPEPATLLLLVLAGFRLRSRRV